jgi:hypothetical protein
MIKNWESTFNKGWNDRSKFIHSAELGFREFIFGDLDINQSIIKKGELSFQNPYQSLAQKLEPIVNSSIIDWLIKNHSD